jgi:hypothetical protein
MMRHYLLILFFFSGLLIPFCSTGQDALKSIEIGCDDMLWNYVYNAYRLQVIEQCKKVTGVVVKSRTEPDGDLHIQLRLDKGYELLLVNTNYDKQNGCLVIEPVCVTEVTQYSALGICDDFVNTVYLPKFGEHVEVTGSYVIDTKHGWAEIHPVTKIVLLKD